MRYYEDDHSITYLSSGYTHCCVCRKIPTTIYWMNIGIWTYYHCPSCDMKDYKPKGFLRKLFWLINKRFLKDP